MIVDPWDLSICNNLKSGSTRPSVTVLAVANIVSLHFTRDTHSRIRLVGARG